MISIMIKIQGTEAIASVFGDNNETIEELKLSVITLAQVLNTQNEKLDEEEN